MQVLTPLEARSFSLRMGLAKSTISSPETARSEFTTDVGRRCAYANMLTNHLITNESAVACLDITRLGRVAVFSEPGPFLFLSAVFGRARLLIDAHFHVFTAVEANKWRNILRLGLISLFDVAGASTTTDFRFYASHDEYIDVGWYEGADWKSTMEWFFAP